METISLVLKLKKTNMKIFSLSLIFTIFCFAVNAQKFTNKINLKNGSTYEVATNVVQSMNMGGMEMTTKIASTLKLDVTSVTDEEIQFKAKIIKIKSSGEVMGNTSEYDSEKPDSDNNPEMTEALKGKLEEQSELSVNRLTGESKDISASKKDKDPVDDLMNAAGSNEGNVVNEMFFLVPKDKKVGDTWTTLVEKPGTKTENKYTLKEVKGNVATIEFVTITNNSQAIPVEGMDMNMNLKMTSIGSFTVNIETAMLEKKTTKLTAEGTTEIMGQSSPIEMSSNVETIYYQK